MLIISVTFGQCYDFKPSEKRLLHGLVSIVESVVCLLSGLLGCEMCSENTGTLFSCHKKALVPLVVLIYSPELEMHSVHSTVLMT